MRRTDFCQALIVGGCVVFACQAEAQSSVTLYGAIDNGLAYQSSQAALGSNSGGRSVIKTTSGAWWGSRFGLKGAEDLGGGTKAIFTLESGFSGQNGTQQFTNAMFGRQEYIGATNPAYGTLTMGRQYSSYYQIVAPYGPTTYLSGAFGAHPGDVDALDTIYRTNNTLLYLSPTFYGVTVSGSYSLGGVAGSLNRGSTWTAGAKYAQGPFGVAVGFSRINNSTLGGGAFGPESTTSNSGAQAGVSAVTNGYQTAQSQQRFAVSMAYKFNSTWDVSGVYSNVQYIPGVGSSFRDTAIFNTGGVALHWKPTTPLDLALGYAYTRATESNGITSSAQYHQVTLTEYYSLSVRTALYAGQSYQRASGSTLGTAGAGHIINATASVGDFAQATPASSRSMVVIGAGIVHKF